MAGNEIEWVDDDPASGGPADVVHVGGRGPNWGANRRWLYALAALVIVIGLVVAFRPHDTKRGAGASPTASPSRSTAVAPPSPAPSTSPAGPAAATPDPSAVTTVPGGSPLLNVAPDWVLYGHGSSSIFRIQLATGQVVSSPIPLLSSDGQSALIVGPGQVIVQPVDSVAGFAVPDGQPAHALPAAFPVGGSALPGPDASHLWISADPDDTTMTLIGFDGTSTGTTLKVPSQYGTPFADGAGYLLFYGTGGIYDLRPTGITRVTTGDLIATGPTAFLTNECDAQYRCSITAINRATGARHTLRASTTQYGSIGVISPDGSTAAVLTGDNTVPAQVHLINLATGADTATAISLDPNFNYQDGLFVWSPDSKWLFVTNGVGRIYAVDVAANKVTELGVNLGPISQLALRAS